MDQVADTNATVESLTDQIAGLVGERQSLRAAAADAEALERNRREIGRLQWQLSQALIALYLPTAPPQPA